MAGRAQIKTSSSALIAMIADEDTVTGFLMAGVGNVDLRRKTNYLIVDSKTTVKAIEDAFKEFTTREDVAIILISQYVANMIRFLVDSYNNPIPAILEIPSKDHPYDPAHDSVLSRVKYLFSTESVASGSIIDHHIAIPLIYFPVIDYAYPVRITSSLWRSYISRCVCYID
ncbi:ATPase, V1 complex, subunit F, eukaryotic [Corchorus capsularis]|uniref:ATPase, V1 complex, subunit F, eukaryotic n=1 Tax=Corchorus capsularis TaxID=210143 RepID=A0A1R3GBD6_COCAP|nr:ATPase, V1 complex, subunit F, eukaryotic [Corchorus capsularis]